MTTRVHPFPSRTRKLSSFVPTILGWRRPGKIGQRLHSSLAQSVEHAAVNRRVVCSSQTGGAEWKALAIAGAFLICSFVFGCTWCGGDFLLCIRIYCSFITDIIL